MQRLEVSGAVRPIYGVVRRQTVNIVSVLPSVKERSIIFKVSTRMIFHRKKFY